MPRTIHVGELSFYIVEFSAYGFVASSLVAILAVILIFQDDASTPAILLLSGALSSPFLLLLYMFMMINKVFKGRPTSGIRAMFFAVSGFIPLAFGCYLFFYEGLLGFVRLISSFTFSSLLDSSFYLVTGMFIVVDTVRLTGLGMALDEGYIVVKKPFKTSLHSD